MEKVEVRLLLGRVYLGFNEVRSDGTKTEVSMISLDTVLYTTLLEFEGTSGNRGLFFLKTAMCMSADVGRCARQISTFPS